MQYHHQSISSMGNSLYAVGASDGRQQHSSHSGLLQQHNQSNHYQQYASSYPQGYSPELRSSPTIIHQSSTHTYYYPNDNYVNQTSPQQLHNYSIQNNTKY